MLITGNAESTPIATPASNAGWTLAGLTVAPWVRQSSLSGYRVFAQRVPRLRQMRYGIFAARVPGGTLLVPERQSLRTRSAKRRTRTAQPPYPARTLRGGVPSRSTRDPGG